MVLLPSGEGYGRYCNAKVAIASAVPAEVSAIFGAFMIKTPPEYRALEQELKKVCDPSQAGNALVFDHVGLIWCNVIPVFRAQRRIVFDLIKAPLETVDPPLKRGGHLDRSIRGTKYSLYCKSFAVTYVVGVLFDGAPADLLVRRVIKAGLPRIEALTLSLPPPDGPERNAGVDARSIP